jgi:mono/diheme cytochrome c family protein
MADAPKVTKYEPPKELEQKAAVQKFQGRAKRQPVEQAEYFYNVKTTHIVFFVSSLLMLVSFLLMFRKDHVRGWKDYQTQFQEMDFEKLWYDLGRHRNDLKPLESRIKELEDESRTFLDLFRGSKDGLTLPVTLFDDEAVRKSARFADPKWESVHVTVDEAKKKLVLREIEDIRGEHYAKAQLFNFAKDEQAAVRNKFETAQHHVEHAEKVGDARLSDFQKHLIEAKRKFDEVNALVVERKRAFDEVDSQNTYYQDFLLMLEGRGVPEHPKLERAKTWAVKERLLAGDLQTAAALEKSAPDAAAKGLFARLAAAYAATPERKKAIDDLLKRATLEDGERKILASLGDGKPPAGRPDLNVLWRLSQNSDRLSKAERDLVASLGAPALGSEDRDALAKLKALEGEARKFVGDLLRIPLGDLNKGIVALQKEVKDRELRFAKERPSFANTVRNKPMSDFFAPTLKIQQVILPDLKDQLNFTKVDKVDRCHTCHVGISNPNYEVVVRPDAKHELEKYVFKDEFLRKFVAHATVGKSESKDCEVCDLEGRKSDAFKKQMPEPRTKHGAWSIPDAVRFTKALMAHPRLDLYVSDNAKHPLGRFGCTICHEGDGRDTDFTRVVHTPDSPEEATAWRNQHGTPYGEERYNWGYRELWDLPMIPTKHLQSSCRRCHTTEVELDGGERYATAMKLYERVGCYGCHRTDTYLILPKDTSDPRSDPNRKSRRPGPPLTRISAKVGEDWALKWLLAPREFRPTTRMPHFFGQSNTRSEVNKKQYPPRKDDAGVLRSPIEDTIARSIVKYVWSLSDAKEDPAPSAKGDAKRGELVVKQVGCLACHKVNDVPAEEYRQWVGKSRYLEEFAPSLAGIGSKIKSKAWLTDWVRNPKHYFKDSSMPNLRLSEQEGADVVEYLMALKKPEWEKVAPPPAANPEILEGLIYEQLRLKMPDVDAKAQLAGANPELKDTDARLLWLGKKMVANYGCYSCHELRRDGDLDWQNIEGIGVELTGSQPFGSKHHDRLDFGFAADDNVNHHGITFRHGFTDAPIGAHVPEGRTPWLRNKLLNPRLYDGGKMASKPPDELLRMPNFGLTEWEADLISTFVLSFTDHNVAGLVAGAQKRMNPDEIAMNRGNRIARDSNCHSCHRFALDRLDIEWKRFDAAKRKDVTSVERVEGRLKGEAKSEDAESTLKKWGLWPAKATAEELKQLKVYSFGWASDHRTLQHGGAVNPDNVFVAYDGTDYWYLDTDAKGQPIKRRVLRRQPMEGGEILPTIEATKKALNKEYVAAFEKATEELDDLETKADKETDAAKKKALKDQHAALEARIKKDFPTEKLLDPGNAGEFEVRYPPMLRTQGVKTQADWLYAFLKEPHPIRPNLAPIQKDSKFMPERINVRMPTFEFSDEEAASLTRWFAVRDHDVARGDIYPHTSFPEREPATVASRMPAMQTAMTKVIVDPSTGCASCHYVNGKVPPGEAFKHAPELGNVAARLRPRWMYEWQRLPADIYPGTTMILYDFKPLFPGAPDPQKEGVRATVEAMLNWNRLNQNK